MWRCKRHSQTMPKKLIVTLSDWWQKVGNIYLKQLAINKIQYNLSYNQFYKKGDLEALNNMLLEGYDHIMDVAAPDGTTIEQVASSRGHQDIVRFLEGIRNFEVS